MRLVSFIQTNWLKWEQVHIALTDVNIACLIDWLSDLYTSKARLVGCHGGFFLTVQETGVRSIFLSV